MLILKLSTCDICHGIEVDKGSYGREIEEALEDVDEAYAAHVKSTDSVDKLSPVEGEEGH